jgi:hypothetical protein
MQVTFRYFRFMEFETWIRAVERTIVAERYCARRSSHKTRVPELVQIREKAITFYRRETIEEAAMLLKLQLPYVE